MANPSASLPHPPQPRPSYAIRKIMVAHDGSPAAENALKDAIDLAHTFNAEIVLARVELPEDDYSTASLAAGKSEAISDLEQIHKNLSQRGLKSHILTRTGLVGDTLFDISHKERGDILMLGAYGHGRRDRQTLGSTAEHLLRSIPCPALTYGPEAQPGLMDGLKSGRPILVPIPMPCVHCDLDFAAQAASLFNSPVELLHIIQGPHTPRIHSKHEKICRDLARGLEKQGIKASWNIFFGVPEVFIHAVAVERNTPLILIPLQRRDRLSSITSDNVAAQIIRRSRVPVMSYRLD
ncbi:MAG: universal stress protein [Acidobacteriaceae bacterium]